tara:strand:- start:5496 stop:5717 length:222 start_codon:yes stop_codon:yes gene_type:complete
MDWLYEMDQTLMLILAVAFVAIVYYSFFAANETSKIMQGATDTDLLSDINLADLSVELPDASVDFGDLPKMTN